MTIRTLVVDDSIIFRKVVRHALETIDSVEVVGNARDGIDAVAKIESLKPDLVTLDVEMPKLDGLGVLEQIQKLGIKTQVIMVSSLTDGGAQVTTKALSKGAFDFILKPQVMSVEEGAKQLCHELKSRIQVLPGYRQASSTIHETKLKPSTIKPPLHTKSVAPADYGSEKPVFPPNLKAVFLGISTGGPKALGEVIPRLPSGLPVPIVIVQHMPPMFTATLASTLDSKSKLEVVEASDGLALEAGSVYIAPGGKQMRVRSHLSGKLEAEVTDDAPVRSCKPSVDYLMKSVPPQLAASSLAIIATGMGDDGLDGCTQLRKHGAKVWSQSERTCTVFGMPRQIQEHGISDSVFDLSQLPLWLSQAARPGSFQRKSTIPVDNSSTPTEVLNV